MASTLTSLGGKGSILSKRSLGANQIAVFCTPLIRRETTKPSLCYLDVTFLDGAESKLVLDTIMFQNYYTSSISVNMQTGPMTFVPVLENKVIMPDPYCEAGGQSWVTISASEFNGKYEKGKYLRITLVQPSTMWTSFEIRNLQAYGRPVEMFSISTTLAQIGGSAVSSVSSPRTSTSNKSTIKSAATTEAGLGATVVRGSLSAVAKGDLSSLSEIIRRQQHNQRLLVEQQQQNSSSAQSSGESVAKQRKGRTKRAPRAVAPSTLEP